MKNFLKILGSVAPTVATAMGGPMAGVATKFVAGALLGKENCTTKELETAILSASPEQLAKLREIDANFEVEMKRLDVDLESIAVNDRKSARELAKGNMWPQIALSIIFIGGYFWMLYALFSGDIELTQGVRDMANILIGVLTAGIPMILRFWFGGSPQDEAHMDRIYNSVPKE